MDNRKSLDYDKTILIQWSTSDYILYMYKNINNYCMRNKIDVLMTLKYITETENYQLNILCHEKDTDKLNMIINQLQDALKKFSI